MVSWQPVSAGGDHEQVYKLEFVLKITEGAFRFSEMHLPYFPHGERGNDEGKVARTLKF